MMIKPMTYREFEDYVTNRLFDTSGIGTDPTVFARVLLALRQREEAIDALMKSVTYDCDQISEINLFLLGKACDLAIAAKEKENQIVVNGRRELVTAKRISYAEVVFLAFPQANPNIVYTITYRRGYGNKTEGSLSPDGSLKVKNGMIFNVSDTSGA